MAAASGSGGERGYTEQATEDLLLKVLEKEFREAMRDVLEDRRKITDPDVCNIFNLWYLRNHVNEIRREMHRMEHRISMIFTFLGVGFTVLATLITLFQFMG